MQTVDLRPRLAARDPAVMALLAHCVFPNPARLEAAAARYAETDLVMLGLQRGGELLGLLGLDESAAEQTVIIHIAVQPTVRGRGLGRKLLQLAVERCAVRLGAVSLYAETDSAAVGFYRANGFQVSSLGELYPSVERFACRLQYSNVPRAMI